MGRKGPVVSFGGRYLLLNAEKATLLDLIELLISNRIGKRRSVTTSKETEEGDLQYRFLIFVSLVVQKILLYVATPMESLGSVMELMLNTLSCNGGLLGLFFKFLWGKVVIPDSASKNYVSVVGNMDTRVHLDGNLKPGDVGYNGALAIMAAKTAYENNAFTEAAVSNCWKMEFVGAYDFWNVCVEKLTTHAFLMLDKSSEPETYVVSFRGTRPFNAYEWCTDFDISWYEIPGVGRGHAGFMEALGMQKTGWPKELDEGDTTQPQTAYYFLKKKLEELLEQNSGAKFAVTGHSLGGALAIMFPSLLAINQEEWLLERLAGVYTFGQPRVGDEQFGDFVSKQFDEYGVNYTRYVYCNDMVPRLPADDTSLLYKHFGSCLYFNSLYQGKSCEQEPNKNYFSIWAVVPMLLNANWEILRSYLIPFVAGWGYRETWLLKFCRLFGLLVPGLPDHCPQDYDNSTRLEPISSNAL